MVRDGDVYITSTDKHSTESVCGYYVLDSQIAKATDCHS
jgi:hypothetical protein